MCKAQKFLFHGGRQSSYIAAMKKFRPAIPVAALFAIIAIFIIGLWLARQTSQWFFNKPKVYPTPVVIQQVQTLSQLVTVKYVMEKIVIDSNVEKFDIKWALENKVLLVAHGIVKAGVDLSKLKPEDVKISGKKISIRLPPPRVTDAYLDEKKTYVVEHTTGLLRNFDKDLQQSARQKAVSDMDRGAREAGILKDADERAQAQLKNLFLQMGFEEVEFLPR